MNPPAALLAIAAPSETALLDFARAPSRVSREMIHEIAANDHGEDTDIHELAILKQIAPKPTLGLLPWHPREVLELQRWSEPERAYLDSPPEGPRGHFKRLFACTILLRNAAYVTSREYDEEDFIATSAASVIQLVRSCIALGSQASRFGIGFLLWLHGKQSHPLLRPFVSFGVLLLQIHQDLSGTTLPLTCAWVESEENSAREQLKKTDDVSFIKVAGGPELSGGQVGARGSLGGGDREARESFTGSRIRSTANARTTVGVSHPKPQSPTPVFVIS